MKTLISKFSLVLFILLIAPLLPAQSLPDTTWECIGPAGGQMMGLVQDVNSPGTLYALVDTGFIYKSTDGGDNWTAFRQTGGYRYFENFEVSPVNSLYLYAQALIVSDWSRPCLRSTDGGITWNLIPIFPTIFHPINADTVYAFSSDTLKVSGDGGMTWTFRSKLPAYPAYNGNIAIIVGTNQNIIIARDMNDTLRRSTDNGKTWTYVPRPDAGNLVAKILTQRMTKKQIYTVNTSTSGGCELFISRDEGRSWGILAANPQGTSVRVTGLFLPPSDTATIWMTLQDVSTGAVQIVKSTNQGSTWSTIPKSFDTYESPSGIFNPLNKDVLVLSENYFISKTTDGGMTWDSKTSGILAHVGDHITFNHNASVVLFYVSYSPYLYRVASDSEWTMGMMSNDITSVMSAPSDSSKFYLFSNMMDTIFVSSNFGLSWVKVGTNFKSQYVSGTTSEGLSNISIDPNDANTLFFNAGSGSGLYKTTNGGSVWTKMSDTATAGVAVAPSNSSILYGIVSLPKTGYSTMYPRKSVNGGSTWTTITTGFPSAPVQWNDRSFLASSLVINPNDPNTVFVGGILRKSGSYDSICVYRTTDGGTTWTLLRNGLPVKFQADGKMLNKVSISSNPFDAKEYVLVIPEAGIFGTTDGGDSWSLIPNPTDRVPLTATIFRTKKIEGLITGFYAGSFYVVKVRDLQVGVKNEGLSPTIYALEQNYPNPFNPATTIKFQIGNIGMVKLKLYDILGREVAILVNEFKKSGTYEVQWNALNFPSGVYFYKLTTGNYTQIKKMTLLK